MCAAMPHGFEYHLIRRLRRHLPLGGEGRVRRKIFAQHLWNAKPCGFGGIFDTGLAQYVYRYGFNALLKKATPQSASLTAPLTQGKAMSCGTKSAPNRREAAVLQFRWKSPVGLAQNILQAVGKRQLHGFHGTLDTELTQSPYPQQRPFASKNLRCRWCGGAAQRRGCWIRR